MVTSPPRRLWDTVESWTLGGVGGLDGTHHSFTHRQWNCSRLPWKHKASPPRGDLYSASAPSLGTGRMGPQEEQGKEGRGCCVLDKETIDVSAFSPSLNWDGDKIKSSGRKPSGDLQHWSTSLVQEETCGPSPEKMSCLKEFESYSILAKFKP